MSLYDGILVAALFLAATIVASVGWRVPAFRPQAFAPSSRRRFCGYAIVAWLLLSGILTVTGTETANAWARRILRSKLAQAKSNGAAVFVNGAPARRPDVILDELATVRFVFAHHSAPENARDVEIGAPAELQLRVEHDGERMDEYWIFWPEVSRDHEIGRVRSTRLGRALSDVETPKSPRRE